MLEMIFAVAIIALAAGGLGLGLMLGRGPALTTCSAAENRPEGRCADCPLRRRTAEDESQ
ncbi:hypothetical protein [Marivita sp. XM-24bin2]|jgi:hypothetical protein|uniref:hypothetical protein n=1 Tax=unclassified Marivita TaxID=2632480 RepID=UPI000D7B129A|nr:hypothetical protein [Marivita sp. XM-24bin2]MCR9110677.1 hypothetical protein [Paracoccaceae bacterium]PWL33771.1 MAG: hypothetical protein DCO97_17805 [Marivita sp. XM-24bin2]